MLWKFGDTEEVWSDPFLLLHKPLDSRPDAAQTLSAAAGTSATAQSAADRPLSRTTASLGRRAAHAVAWNGIQIWGYNIVSLGVFVVLGRLLSPQDFGLAASAMVVIWFMRIVVDAGFSRLLVQRSEINQTFADTAFWTALLLGVLFTATTAAAAPGFALLFGQPRLTALIRGLSIIFIFVALDSTPTALLQRELRWRSLALRRIAATGASAAIAVWLASSGAGAWALVGQQLVLEGLTVLLLWFVTSWRPGFRFARSAFGELLAFGSRYSALRVLWYLGANVDNFLIGVFLGPVALGYYVIAYRVFTVLNELFGQTLNNVALPIFSKLQDDKPALNHMFCRASGATSLIAFPAYGGLAITAAQLLPALFGEKWRPSVPVLELLTIAGVAQVQLALTSSYVISIGLIKRELPWTLAVTAAELAGFAISVHFGITAVAGALAAILAVAWPIRLFFLRAWGGLSLSLYARTLAPAVLATAAMCALLLPIHLLSTVPALGTLLLEIIVGVLAYALALLVFAPSAARDLRDLLRRRGLPATTPP